MTIKERCLRLITSGLSNEQVAKRVREEVSGARTSAASVAWYRSSCRAEAAAAAAAAEPAREDVVEPARPRAPKAARLRWKREEKATGLARAAQGERGWDLLDGQDVLGRIKFNEGEDAWEAWVYKSEGTNARLRERWKSDDVAGAKDALVAAVRKYGKLRAEG